MKVWRSDQVVSLDFNYFRERNDDCLETTESAETA